MALQSRMALKRELLDQAQNRMMDDHVPLLIISKTNSNQYNHHIDTEKESTINMAEVHYSTIITVTSSWAKVKQIPDYQGIAGESIVRKLLEIRPELRSIFGMTKGNDDMSDPKIHRHGLIMMEMIELALDELGPDLSVLKEDLMEQGKRHADMYGVEPSMLSDMTSAVISVLRDQPQAQFTEEDEKAWQDVMHLFTFYMRLGMENSESGKYTHGSDELVLSQYLQH